MISTLKSTLRDFVCNSLLPLRILRLPRNLLEIELVIEVVVVVEQKTNSFLMLLKVLIA
jgi:hypothetical protein